MHCFSKYKVSTVFLQGYINLTAYHYQRTAAVTVGDLTNNNTACQHPSIKSSTTTRFKDQLEIYNKLINPIAINLFTLEKNEKCELKQHCCVVHFGELSFMILNFTIVVTNLIRREFKIFPWDFFTGSTSLNLSWWCLILGKKLYKEISQFVFSKAHFPIKINILSTMFAL